VLCSSLPPTSYSRFRKEGGEQKMALCCQASAVLRLLHVLPLLRVRRHGHWRSGALNP
jgi:hypothetical protein